MDYDYEIIRVLTEAGDKGLKVDKISRHVFNACNSMFAPADYERVHQYVGQYLYRNAFLVKHPFIQKIGWGKYRLDRCAARTAQLSFHFQDTSAPPEPLAAMEDHTLPLFPFEGE